MSVTEPELLRPGLQSLKVSQLRESDENPRYITGPALERLKYALASQPEMLRARPLICDEHGVVIAGNMRLRAAQELGWTTVPAYVHPFKDEKEKREWMLRDNQEYGDWVPDLLASMVAQHLDDGGDQQLLGFSEEEVEALVRRATGDAIVPDPSEPPDPKLTSAVLIEIRCTKDGFNEIHDTLEYWESSVDGVEIAVSG